MAGTAWQESASILVVPCSVTALSVQGQVTTNDIFCSVIHKSSNEDGLKKVVDALRVIGGVWKSI